MDALAKIFGSPARLKLMRLFLFNPQTVFAKEDIAKRVRLSPKTAYAELVGLEKSGLIKKRVAQVEKKDGGMRRTQGYAADPAFPFFGVLQKFMIDTTLIAKEDILGKLRPAGRIDLLIISGVFTRQWDARLDLLVVGSRLSAGTLQEGIKHMEAEMGRELQYATLSTEEFFYRRSIGDRLIRDVVDFPHEVLVDRIGLR